MDSEKIIIYVVIGIVYYGYRYFMKNFGTSKNTQKQEEPTVSNPANFPEWKKETVRPEAPQVERSIFDLLEEIKKQENRNVSAPSYERQPEQAVSLEDTDYELEPQKVVIEEVNPYKYRPVVNVESVQKNAKVFDSKEYLIPKKPHPLLSTLKDPKKVKEAFILGEILSKRF